MTEITLVRHGQANSFAKSEEAYDQLSELGLQQAAWLGAYLAHIQAGYDCVIHGGMQRQRDTADAIVTALGLTAAEDIRLNEFDYFGLEASIRERLDVPSPNGREDFLAHVPQVLLAWRSEKIETPVETYHQFETRVKGVLNDAIARGDRVMLVTSGGVISMMMRLVLGLNDAAHAGVLLQTRNASFHKFTVEGGRVLLEGFNATPHLEGPDRAGAKTFI